MLTRLIAILALAIGMLVAPQVAQAATGYVTGDLNLRTCASTRCQKIAVMPEGSRVQIVGQHGNWYAVVWHNVTGYAHASYIDMGGPYPVYRRPPPPTYGFYRNPWWDNRYGAWYDGHRWYFNGRWYDRPSGFYFGFRFGG